MLKKEEDDPKDAIIFFTPDSVSDDTQCSLVGQLMGMTEFLSSTVSISHPSVIKLETEKYIMKRVNKYSMVLQGFPNESNRHLTSQLEHLYKCFVTFHGSIDSLSLRFKGSYTTFLAELKSIWTEILELCGFDQNLLTQAFNHLSYVDLPKNASHLFLQASFILQSSQRRPYVLAGVILYKNGIVCSQLTPELTKLLILAQSQLPCLLLQTDFEMPMGCKLLTVFLTDGDYFSVHPFHPDAKRHYKVSEFSKCRESVQFTKDKTQSRTEKSPKRHQAYPQEGDSSSPSQKHSRISLSGKEISPWSDRRQITSIVGVPLVECKSGEWKEEEEMNVMLGFSAKADHFGDKDGKHLSPNHKDIEKSKYEIQSDTHSKPSREKDQINHFENNKESQNKNSQNTDNAERAKVKVDGSCEEETVNELENEDPDKAHEKRSHLVEENISGIKKHHNINSDKSELETNSALDIENYSFEVDVDSDGSVCGTEKHFPDHESVIHTDVPKADDEIPSSEIQQGDTKCKEQPTDVFQFKAISVSLIEEDPIPSSENQQDNTNCNEQTTNVSHFEPISASLIEKNNSDIQQDVSDSKVLETENEQISHTVNDDISVQEQEYLNNIKSSVTEACSNKTGIHGHITSKVLVETETLEVAKESGTTEKATNKASVSDRETYKTESDKQTVRKSLLLISSIARSGLHSDEEKENVDAELKDAREAETMGKLVAEQTNDGFIDVENHSKKSAASFSSSEDIPSSTQLDQEQFRFQFHGSNSNTEVMTSEEVKDIMTSYVSCDNKADKQNTVQGELDCSLKNHSQKDLIKTSFLGSFSSDQSSDSILSKVWTPDMDGLNDLTLYVQRHSDISLLLLMENPVQNEEAVLHMLWKSAVPQIADLGFYIKEYLEQSADKQNFLDQYNYLKYEDISNKLKGNSLDILENSEIPFQQLTSTIHEEFLESLYMYDVLLRTQTLACHGHRTPVAEHYFQLNVAPRLTSGLPVPNDPVFCLDQLARKKMANTSNAIL
ncbi:hypothetical protein CHS0354_035976 [Potamilus streckersoni]|uniref:CCZ1/INTU/HSP4 first Longin domain-containing protein n=1 Tax=Potamilus streckersoni TaxID=2493646 RepID=A0AAE0SCK1_9BIVA|nr:hypothetical protein CHS0354_035976 [Potamilus streckersoni]